MGISFPHTLDRNQRYAYWFPLPWSQRDESSSLAFTASCNQRKKKLIGELGKLGSNLNQIARYFNQGGIISSEMRTEIKKSLRDIYEMKYEVMRMAGDFRGSD